MRSIRKTNKLLVLDDSKSLIKYGDILSTKILEDNIKFQYMNQIRRGTPDNFYGVNHDQLEYDINAIFEFISKGK